MAGSYGASGSDDLPVVDGLTETAPDGESLPSRLTAFLAQRPGTAASEMSRALHALEDAFSKEANPKLRARIMAARSLLLDGPSKDE